ncbi:UNVERIFIED_CONTAM: hypothetical protein FKN15_011941 [Acipenser sinensis]
MEEPKSWLLDPNTLQWREHKTADFAKLPHMVQVQGIHGQYLALKRALDAMTRVVSQIHEDRWEAEQSRLAREGAAWCTICLLYGHDEANCPELDRGTDPEWEEPLLCPQLPRFLEEVPLVEKKEELSTREPKEELPAQGPKKEMLPAREPEKEELPSCMPKREVPPFRQPERQERPSVGAVELPCHYQQPLHMMPSGPNMYNKKNDFLFHELNDKSVLY